MRVIRRLLALAVPAAFLLIGAPEAIAGGPTSVIIVNPATGATGSLYTSDPDYAILEAALEPAQGTAKPSNSLRGGPGTSALNVTWLVHDVSVWRVDRVLLNLDDGPWVQSVDMDLSSESALDWEHPGDWTKAADPERVLGVFDRLGVLTDSADETFSRTWTAENPNTQTTAAGGPGLDTNWWWVLPGMAVGIGVGMAGRPWLASLLRNRDRGRRQQLIDV